MFHIIENIKIIPDKIKMKIVLELEERFVFKKKKKKKKKHGVVCFFFFFFFFTFYRLLTLFVPKIKEKKTILV